MSSITVSATDTQIETAKGTKVDEVITSASGGGSTPSAPQTVTLPAADGWTGDTFTIGAKQTAVIDADYTIPAGKRLIVAAGGCLTVNAQVTTVGGEPRGELRVQQGGTLTANDTAAFEGSVVLEVGASLSQSSVAAPYNRYAVTEHTALSGNVTLSSDQYIEVENGGVLAIGSGSVLTADDATAGLHIQAGGRVTNQGAIAITSGQLVVDADGALTGGAGASVAFGDFGSVTGEGLA